MSKNDHDLEMVLSKILKFNRDVTKNQKNKKINKVVNKKKLKKTTNKDKSKKQQISEEARAIKKIEDQLRISSENFLRQNQ